MKKLAIFSIVALMSVGTMMAQHVAPLSFVPTEFNLEELRVQYPDSVAYLGEMKAILQSLKNDENSISVTNKEIKDEAAHLKNVLSFIKSRTSQLGKLDKIYKSELKELAGYSKTLDAQQKAMVKYGNLDKVTRDNYLQRISARRTEILNSEARCQACLQDVQIEREYMKTLTINAQQYELEINTKTAEMQQLSEQNKSQIKNIEGEIGIVEKALKSKK